MTDTPLTLAPPPPVLPPDAENDVQAERILVNRYRKARKCAQAILGAGGDAAQAEVLGRTIVGRTLTAQVAQCNVPSTTTWSLIVELVREVRP